MRRQAGLGAAGVGLALIARAADLPGAASFALAATLLTAIGGSAAGVPTSLAVHTIGESAGTYRLSRLGGLIHAMPVSSAALAAGLLGLSALPPGLGFAGLWLMFEAILSAPRTGGLLFQLPLALTAAALALSASLATAGSVRLIGIAVLGRPRTPQGAGAREGRSPCRLVLLALAGLSLVAGILPGPLLWMLADPSIHALTGAPRSARIGLTLLMPSVSAPSYLALPVLALLALGTGAAMQVSRRSRKEAKTAGLWADGMAPPVGLPFGEPAAQSAGQGFLPTLPELPGLPRIPTFTTPRRPSAVAGLWLIVAAFGALLLVLAVTG
jgi:hydrogenase-4 component B